MVASPGTRAVEGACCGDCIVVPPSVSVVSVATDVVAVALRVVPSEFIPHVSERASLVSGSGSAGSLGAAVTELRVLLAMPSVGAADVADTERRGRGPTLVDVGPGPLLRPEGRDPAEGEGDCRAGDAAGPEMVRRGVGAGARPPDGGAGGGAADGGLVAGPWLAATPVAVTSRVETEVVLACEQLDSGSGAVGPDALGSAGEAEEEGALEAADDVRTCALLTPRSACSALASAGGGGEANTVASGRAAAAAALPVGGEGAEGAAPVCAGCGAITGADAPAVAATAPLPDWGDAGDAS